MNRHSYVQKILLNTLAAVLVLGIGTTQVFALEGFTTNGESQNAPLVNSPQQLELVDCSVDSGDIVAFDVSQGQDPSLAYPTMISDLETNGFVVKTVNISLESEVPNCIVKLVISSAATGGSCIDSTYLAADITKITNFVNNGGAAYVSGEREACSGTGTEVLEVINAFGVTTTFTDAVETLTSGVNYDSNIPATLWNGVNSFFVNGVTEFNLPTDGVVATYSGTGNGAVIAKEFGQGCVLIYGNSEHHMDLAIGVADNQVLALNSFLYLNECIAPKVGGEFLPIDTTALLVAGIQTNAVWILTALAGIASAAFGTLYITSKRN